MPFTDLDTVKGVLGIPLTSTRFDDALTAALDAAEALFLEQLHLDSVDPTSYDLTADVVNQGLIRSFRLEPIPVISVDSLTVLGTTLAATRYTHRGGVVRLADPIRVSTDQAIRVIEVTVTAGFSSVPAWLSRAVASLAASLHRANPAAGVESERFGRYAITHAAPTNLLGWPQEAVAALQVLSPITSMLTARRED